MQKLPFVIGWRYTRAHKKDNFISIITIVSVLGMLLGVAVLILVLSVMNGFDRELRTRILGMVPHASILNHSNFSQWQGTAEKIAKMPHIKGVAPFVKAQGMLANRGYSQGAEINGILPDWEEKVSIVGKYMKKGSLEDLKPGSHNIVLGDLLARHLRLNIGDKVTLFLPEASITPGGIFPRIKRFTLIGTFSVGAELDGVLGYAHLEDMQRVLRLGENIQGLRLEVDDLFQAPLIMRSVLGELGAGFSGTDWTFTQGNLFQAIHMEKNLIGLLLFILVLVASFNIVSSLVMAVNEKRADIAILRTLGATPKHILQIFIVQGLIMGVMGILFGTILGLILAYTISDIVAFIEAIFQTQFLNPNVYFISYLPSQVLFSDVSKIVGAALFISAISTLYPAYRASKVAPAEALRYE